ncbi:MAG: metallophosphoesterase [Fimbriimonadaceae bacterium]|nr:metallophosphoesterase [Fimbriimonadaceae bacterium]
MTVTLLQTNDLHGYLTPAGAAWLRELKAACAPAVLVDSGDAVVCGNVGWRLGGEAMHDLLAAAGYDALTLGNREYHFRPWPQRCKLRRARCPVLCANLRPAGYGGTQAWLDLEPAPGARLRLVGLLVPMIRERHWARWISPSWFAEPAAALQAASDPALPTVVLSHLGLRRDEALAAAAAPAIILGGHSHTGLEPPRQVGGTWIFQNHPHGVSVSVVRLEFADGRLRRVDGELRRLPPSAAWTLESRRR